MQALSNFCQEMGLASHNVCFILMQSLASASPKLQDHSLVCAVRILFLEGPQALYASLHIACVSHLLWVLMEP